MSHHWSCCIFALRYQSFLRTTIARMRHLEESRNPALRNRPTDEHTKEILELVRKRAEEDLKNANLNFDQALLRRVSVTRPNEPLPSIRVDYEHDNWLKRRSCPAGLDNEEADTSLTSRWRSLSDAPLLELRNRSPRERTVSSPASDTSATSRRGRTRRLSNILPPLESTKEGFERPNCVPSRRHSGFLLQPKEDINMNLTYDEEWVLLDEWLPLKSNYMKI